MSDHAAFWDAGLPAIMVTDTAFFRNPNYHLPSDTIDTLDFTFMAQLVKSLELALLDLPPLPAASSPRRRQWFRCRRHAARTDRGEGGADPLSDAPILAVRATLSHRSPVNYS
jgi:hypothetical protein